jgi:hypothetical protein
MNVGDIVYPVRQPRKVGKVIGKTVTRDYDMGGPNGLKIPIPQPHRLVRWLDGSEEYMSEYHLKSLDTLIDETQAKLQNHKDRYRKAMNI